MLGHHATFFRPKIACRSENKKGRRLIEYLLLNLMPKRIWSYSNKYNKI